MTDATMRRHGVDNPGPWRDRSREMRELAEVTTDVKAMEIFLRLASDFDQLALRFEELAKRPAAKK